jgi:sugar O-acyltransferase (sialic acid O-acetyltransferase NeuD family)
VEKLLIIGAGSQARYVIDIIQNNKSYNIIGAVDIEEGRVVGKCINGVKILCCLEEVPQEFTSDNVKLILAHGSNQKKIKTAEYLKEYGFKYTSIVSQYAYISTYSHIECGCIINPFAVIMPNARLGKHIIVHSHSTIEHDAIIEDYVNIGPGVSFGGNVHVGEGSYLYTGASIIPKICIGKNSIVGAGSVVTENVPNNVKVVGVPAKEISKKV